MNYIEYFKISIRDLKRTQNDAYERIIHEFPKALNKLRKEFNKELEKFEIDRIDN